MDYTFVLNYKEWRKFESIYDIAIKTLAYFLTKNFNSNPNDISKHIIITYYYKDIFKLVLEIKKY